MRLTADQWEQARAEYEIRGVSLSAVAKNFSLSVSTVSRRAQTEGWKQGEMQPLADRKIAAIKEISDIETQIQQMPLHFRHTLQTVVQERLQADGLLAQLDVVLAEKGVALAHTVDSPGEWEVMTRGRRNLAPAQKETQTTVNVSQQQAAISQPPTPRQAIDEILVQIDDADAKP